MDPLIERDNYVFEQELGHGLMGTVYRAQEIKTGKHFAIKIVSKQYFESEEDLIHFQREISVMATISQLCHPYILRMDKFFEDGENYYLVLELCTGGDLFDYVSTYGPIPEFLAIEIFFQIVTAIGYCHQNGIVHRDIKPENILITEFPKIKVCDFGLCGIVNHSQKMKSFCGSPCYCAPECIRKEFYDGEKSDIYSLGVTLFCMVTGEYPWDVDNMTLMLKQILAGDVIIPKTISKDCRHLIESLLKLNAAERPSINDILSHPWMKSCKLSKGVKQHQRWSLNDLQTQIPMIIEPITPPIEFYSENHKKIIESMKTTQPTPQKYSKIEEVKSGTHNTFSLPPISNVTILPLKEPSAMVLLKPKQSPNILQKKINPIIHSATSRIKSHVAKQNVFVHQRISFAIPTCN